MDNYNNLKIGTKAGLIISLLILVASFVCDIIGVFVRATELPEGAITHIAIDPIMIALVLFYIFFEYKKPHGNVLRYIFLIFAMYMILQSIIPAVPNGSQVNYIVSGSLGIAAVLTAYVGARLDKIEQNKIIMNITSVLLLAGVIFFNCVSPMFNIAHLIGSLSLFSGWCALCFAYLARYEQHKAAGLEDK